MLELHVPLGKVLDMGCGTGILAIMASKMGASSVTAIDIDQQAIENTNENIFKNNAAGILAFKGDLEHIAGKSFDLILANINRNVLLEHLATYAACLTNNGKLLLSGFYAENDLNLITMEAQKNGLAQIGIKLENEWAAACFIKK